MQAANKNLTKFSQLFARWQVTSGPFKTHSIGWGAIQLHHRIVKVVFGFASLDWQVKSYQKIVKFLLHNLESNFIQKP